MAQCAIRSSRSPPRSGSSSPPTSPTSTGRCSPSSTCRRRSRGRCSRATRATQGSVRRLYLDEFAADVPSGGRPVRGRGGRAGGGPLRAGLHRLRRRLDRPGRRRPPRLRVRLEHPHQAPPARPARRLSRAVDPLHPLRLAARGPASRTSPGAGATTATPSSATSTSPRWTSCSRSTRRSLERVQAWAEERWPRGEEPEAAWRRSIRAKALDLLRGLLPAATLSHVGIFASGQAYEQLLLRMLASPLPEAREFAAMMLDGAAQGDPELRRPGRAPGARRRVGLLPGAAAARPRSAGSRGSGLDRRETSDAPSVELVHVDGTEDDLLAASLFEGAALERGGRSASASACSTRPSARRCSPSSPASARQPAPPSRTRLGGGPLPLRDRLRLRRLPRPPAPPDADLPVAAPLARPRRGRPRGGPRGGRRRRVRARAGDLADRVRAAHRSRASPRPPPTRSASATGSATCST